MTVSQIYTFVLGAMLALAGRKDLVPRDLAQAIALVVAVDGGVKDWGEELTAAALVVSAWQEGRFCTHCKRGDGGVAVTTFQIHARSEEHARQLEGSNVAAARAALYIIREGARICPDRPLAPYCGGCRVGRARSMGQARMQEARRLASMP